MAVFFPTEMPPLLKPAGLWGWAEFSVRIMCPESSGQHLEPEAVRIAGNNAATKRTGKKAEKEPQQARTQR